MSSGGLCIWVNHRPNTAVYMYTCVRIDTYTVQALVTFAHVLQRLLLFFTVFFTTRAHIVYTALMVDVQGAGVGKGTSLP